MKKLFIYLIFNLPFFVNAQNFYLKGNIGFAQRIKDDGTGANVTAGAGYNLTRHFSIELNSNYFYGSYSRREIMFGSSVIFTNGYLKYNPQIISIIPALIISTANEKINVYNRIGFLLGLGQIKGTFKGKDINNTTIVSQKIKYSGGMTLGLAEAVGVKYKINNRFSIFSELILNLNSYKSKKIEISDLINHSKISYDNKITHSFSSLGINVGLIYQMVK